MIPDALRQSTPDPEQVAIDRALVEVRARQNSNLALRAGTIAAAAVAIGWAAISVFFDGQFRYLAVFAGIAVGRVVRAYGKGVSLPYRLIGAAMGILACIEGNILITIHFAALERSTSSWNLLWHLSGQQFLAIASAWLDFRSFLLYTIAGFFAGLAAAREPIHAAYELMESRAG
jgi:hypothetical protein